MRGTTKLLLARVSALPLALACSTTISASAHAAEAPAAAAAGNALEEVIVTARRRSESLQEVPASVTAISGQALEAAGVRNVLDLQFQTPSLTVNGSGGNRAEVFYSMRGQGQTFGGGGPGVAAYFADVPILAQANAPFLDLESVEVLKGPQGTLFGRNTTGGAVLFNPKRPTSQFGGYVSGQVGNYNLREFTGVLNAPIIPDKISARIAFDSLKQDGYTHNTVDGRDLDNVNRDSFRLGLLFTPNSRFTDYLALSGFQMHDNGGGFILSFVQPGALSTLIFPGLNSFLATQTARGPRITSQDGATFAKRRGMEVVNTAEFHLTDNISVKDIFGYQRYTQNVFTDQDGTPFFILQYPKFTHTKLVTNELQLAGLSLDSKLNWITGFYYEHQTPTGINETLPRVFGGVSAGIGSDQRNDTSKAIFGQGTYDLAGMLPGLKFTAGARYTWDDRSIDPLTGAPIVSASFKAPSWTVGFDYHPTPDLLLYIVTRRGYKAGGLNTIPPTPASATFQPETLTDVELGVKSDWRLGDVAGRTNISVYTGDYKDIQRNLSVQLPGNKLAAATINAASGVARGFDLETKIIPASWFNLSIFYAYTDTYYNKFPILVPGPGGVPMTVDASGSEFTYTPRNKGGVTAEFKTPLPENYGDLSFLTTVSAQSHNYTWDINYNVPEARVPRFTLVNARIDWTRIGGKPVSAALFVNNAFNKDYIVQRNPLSTGALGVTNAGYGPPRMYGVELRYDF